MEIGILYIGLLCCSATA